MNKKGFRAKIAERKMVEDVARVNEEVLGPITDKDKNVMGQRDAEIVRLKNLLITVWVHKQYYTARCNMIVKQVDGDRFETVDGVLKSKEYIYAEYLMMKLKAMDKTRELYFLEKRLTEDYKVAPENIELLKKNFVEKPIDNDFSSEKIMFPKGCWGEVDE